MRASTIVAGLASVAAVLASDVVDLTRSGFDEFIQDSPLALVEFFAPWVRFSSSPGASFAAARRPRARCDVITQAGRDEARRVILQSDCASGGHTCQVEGFICRPRSYLLPPVRVGRIGTRYGSSRTATMRTRNFRTRRPSRPSIIGS